jgi:hypothetical protein
MIVRSTVYESSNVFDKYSLPGIANNLDLNNIAEKLNDPIVANWNDFGESDEISNL